MCNGAKYAAVLRRPDIFPLCRNSSDREKLYVLVQSLHFKSKERTSDQKKLAAANKGAIPRVKPYKDIDHVDNKQNSTVCSHYFVLLCALALVL